MALEVLQKGPPAHAGAQQLTHKAATLDPQLSRKIFARTGQVVSLEVQVPRQDLLPT